MTSTQLPSTDKFECGILLLTVWLSIRLAPPRVEGKLSRKGNIGEMNDGREFEKLVERIERLMAPTGAVIKSPDHLPNVITGKGTREVDVSIRQKVGSADCLVIMECRDRSRKQDVQWIEQIISKRDTVGAHVCIGVSSHGITKGARELADKKGIQLRVIHYFTEEEIRKLNSTITLHFVSYRYNIRSFRDSCG